METQDSFDSSSNTIFRIPSEFKNFIANYLGYAHGLNYKVLIRSDKSECCDDKISPEVGGLVKSAKMKR